MKEANTKLITETISNNLINKGYNQDPRGQEEVEFSNRQFMFEQYKMLVESAHKIEERRGNSNNVFIGINTILVSVMIHINPVQLSKLDIYNIFSLLFLTLIGILLSWDWLKVISSYKKLNSLNYFLIEEFEKLLPTYVFSLRGKMETDQLYLKKSSRANVILIGENVLPKAFLTIYNICFFFVIIIFFRKINLVY